MKNENVDFDFWKAECFNSVKQKVDTTITQDINGMFESLLENKKDRKPEKLKVNWPEWCTC